MTPHHVTQSPRRVIKSSHTGVTASITASANNQLSSVGCDVPLNNVFGTNFTALFPMSETAPADCAVMQTIWPQLKTTRPFNATNCCSTSGITCLGGAITVIELFDTSATGVIPSDFSKLTKLQTLSLYNNQLTGTIPPSLGQISALRFLSIHHNQLNGSIPSSLGQLSSLVGLYLDSNQLTGPIPSTLGDLKSLEGIQLDNNKLSGSVPPELGKIKFNGIYLDNNPDLKGPLPAEWGSLNLGSVCTRGAEASTASQFYCCNLGNLCSAAGTQRPLHCGPTIPCAEDSAQTSTTPVVSPLSSNNSSSLGTGAVIGISVGVVVVIAVIALVLFAVIRHNRAKSNVLRSIVQVNPPSEPPAMAPIQANSSLDRGGQPIRVTVGVANPKQATHQSVVPQQYVPFTQPAKEMIPTGYPVMAPSVSPSARSVENAPVAYLPGSGDEMVSVVPEQASYLPGPQQPMPYRVVSGQDLAFSATSSEQGLHRASFLSSTTNQSRPLSDVSISPVHYNGSTVGAGYYQRQPQTDFIAGENEMIHFNETPFRQ